MTIVVDYTVASNVNLFNVIYICISLYRYGTKNESVLKLLIVHTIQFTVLIFYL